MESQILERSLYIVQATVLVNSLILYSYLQFFITVTVTKGQSYLSERNHPDKSQHLTFAHFFLRVVVLELLASSLIDRIFVSIQCVVILCMTETMTHLLPRTAHPNSISKVPGNWFILYQPQARSFLVPNTSSTPSIFLFLSHLYDCTGYVTATWYVLFTVKRSSEMFRCLLPSQTLSCCCCWNDGTFNRDDACLCRQKLLSTWAMAILFLGGRSARSLRSQ